MAAIDLLNSTQKKYVQNQNIGTSESIIVTHADPYLVENTFAFAGNVKLNEAGKETLSNKVEFANVFLEQEPKANDIIEYDSKQYTVDEDGWSKQNGLYFIIGSEKRHRGGR
jgi:hypothetical protein